MDNHEVNSDFIQNEKSGFSPDNDEINKVKTGHVLTELLTTEKVYVTELLTIVQVRTFRQFSKPFLIFFLFFQGYKHEAKNKDMKHLLSHGVDEKFNVIFGNLEEIHRFHRDIFLKDLENCISSTELVALCFLQKVSI